jgi:hypothetical protein
MISRKMATFVGTLLSLATSVARADSFSIGGGRPMTPPSTLQPKRETATGPFIPSSDPQTDTTQFGGNNPSFVNSQGQRTIIFKGGPDRDTVEISRQASPTPPEFRPQPGPKDPLFFKGMDEKPLFGAKSNGAIGEHELTEAPRANAPTFKGAGTAVGAAAIATIIGAPGIALSVHQINKNNELHRKEAEFDEQNKKPAQSTDKNRSEPHFGSAGLAVAIPLAVGGGYGMLKHTVQQETTDETSAHPGRDVLKAAVKGPFTLTKDLARTTGEFLDNHTNHCPGKIAELTDPRAAHHKGKHSQSMTDGKWHP